MFGCFAAGRRGLSGVFLEIWVRVAQRAGILASRFDGELSKVKGAAL